MAIRRGECWGVFCWIVFGTFIFIVRYPGLTIKYVRGKDPIIKLLDEDDDVVEELAIDKWNTDSVEEFLDTYIEYQEEGILNNDQQTNP